MTWHIHIELPVLGQCSLAGTDTLLQALWLPGGRFTPKLTITGEQAPIGFVTQVQHQLTEFLCGQRQTFALKLAPCGTDFQRRVWQALMQIPYGETCSYSQLAAIIRQPAATRALANAVARNPLLIICPCHRVIRQDGNLGGFSAGIPLKQQLLQLEGNIA